MLKRSWIILVILSVVGLMALPVVAYAHNEVQNCPDDADDNRHPSGKDRSCESGSSEDGATIQGNSGSDPDDNGRGPDRSNGGNDKPNGGVGGLDHADQDSNNGCGNDDDFEDDNEGWCGGKPKPSGGEVEVEGQVGAQGQADTAGSAKSEGTTQVQGGADEANEVRPAGIADSVTQVLGESLVRTALPTAAPTVVLGVEFVRGQTMAVTGTPAGILALIALSLIGIGSVLVRASRVTV